jgi:hypothetical protein
MRPEYRDESITAGEAYDAMFLFLLERRARGERDAELTLLLGDMELGEFWKDGGSLDPAMGDWWNAVQRIRQGFNPYTDHPDWQLPGS